MKKYYTADKATGTIIDEFATYEEASQAIKGYEMLDLEHDCYEEDFYDIVDEEHCSVEA